MGCSYAHQGGYTRRGLILGQGEQEVTVSLGGEGPLQALSRMWIVVQLEKHMFCSCGLFSENGGHRDLEIQSHGLV